MNIYSLIYNRYDIKLLETKMKTTTKFVLLEIYKNNKIMESYNIYGSNIIDNFLFYFKNINIIQNTTQNTYQLTLYSDIKYNEFINKLATFEKIYQYFIF